MERSAMNVRLNLPCYTHLDLFSGIGGFSLGLERSGGFKTIGFCEIEKYPRSILRKHWPDVPIFKDIKELNAKDLPTKPDVITGGFPCQGFSVAGKRRGKKDDRYLWPEMLRLIQECRPAWVIGENVTGIISMALDTVLSDMESEGYTCWPFIIPACAVNAPHRRDRVWILAHSEIGGLQRGSQPKHSNRDSSKDGVADKPPGTGSPRCGKNVAHPGRSGCEKRNIPSKPGNKGHSAGCGDKGNVADTKIQQAGRVFRPWFSPDPESGGDWRGKAEEWTTESPVCGPDDGISDRVARLKALGNAVVPQIPEIIGRAILAV